MPSADLTETFFITHFESSTKLYCGIVTEELAYAFSTGSRDLLKLRPYMLIPRALALSI